MLKKLVFSPLWFQLILASKIVLYKRKSSL